MLESLPRHTQRLSALLEGPAGWAAAEDAIYTDPADPLTRWTTEDLTALLAQGGFTVSATPLSTTHSLHITQQTVSRWLSERPGSYASRLRTHLTDPAALSAALSAAVGRTLPWRSEAVLLTTAASQSPVASA